MAIAQDRGYIKLVKLPLGDEMNTFTTLFAESKFLSLIIIIPSVESYIPIYIQ